MVASLLSDLIYRGLDAQRMRLWVIDGGEALRKAIQQTFGATALIQRCQEYKRRNVVEHLPEELHSSVKRALRDAWSASDADLGRASSSAVWPRRCRANIRARRPACVKAWRRP